MKPDELILDRMSEYWVERVGMGRIRPHTHYLLLSMTGITFHIHNYLLFTKFILISILFSTNIIKKNLSCYP